MVQLNISNEKVKLDQFSSGNLKLDTLDCEYEGFISQNLLNSCIMLGLGAQC